MHLSIRSEKYTKMYLQVNVIVWEYSAVLKWAEGNPWCFEVSGHDFLLMLNAALGYL